jgi:hypothetical protein
MADCPARLVLIVVLAALIQLVHWSVLRCISLSEEDPGHVLR